MAINGFSSVKNPFLNSNRNIVVIKKWSQNLILTIRTVNNRGKNSRVCTEYAQEIKNADLSSKFHQQKSK